MNMIGFLSPSNSPRGLIRWAVLLLLQDEEDMDSGTMVQKSSDGDSTMMRPLSDTGNSSVC